MEDVQNIEATGSAPISRPRRRWFVTFWRAVTAPKVPLAVLVVALLVLGSVMTYWAFDVMPSLRASNSRSEGFHWNPQTTTPTTVAVPPGYVKIELRDANPPVGATERGWICSSGTFPYASNVACFVPSGQALPSGTSVTTASVPSAQTATPPGVEVDWFARTVATMTLLAAMVTALGAVGLRIWKGDREPPKHT